MLSKGVVQSIRRLKRHIYVMLQCDFEDLAPVHGDLFDPPPSQVDLVGAFLRNRVMGSRAILASGGAPSLALLVLSSF